jgi:replicative DNA helicase
MSRSEIVMRMLSAEARIRLGDMRGGRMTEDDWTRLARRIGEIAEAPLYIDDSPNMTMMEIRAKARRLRQRHDLRLVVVDYMQLMTSGKRVESRQQEVSEFSRQLKLLAKELDIPVVAISQLNRGPEQRTDKRPMLADLRESGCVTAATRILRADTGAETSIGELLCRGERPLVWSLDESLRLVPRPMTDVFPTGTKEVFRLRLASGRELEATANHPMLTVDGWVPLGQLAPGDRVATPRAVPEPLGPQPLPDAEVILLAHLLGAGSFAAGQPIRYSALDEANLAAVRAAAQHFGRTPVRDDDPGARTSGTRAGTYRLGHGARNPIATWLEGLGILGLPSQEKVLPERVFALPNEQVAVFLRHLWAAAGSLARRGGSSPARVHYASPSRALVDGLAQLLLRFGILSRIGTAEARAHRPRWALDVTGAEDQRRFLEQVGVHGAGRAAAGGLATAPRGIVGNSARDTIPPQLWRRAREALAARGTPQRRLARLRAVPGASELEMPATNQVAFDEIAEVEPLGEQEVYDATVAGTHNYVANGLSIHNSLEQDADIVLLISRPDAWERDDPRAGEADLILAKHRSGPTNTITVAHQLHYSRFVDLAQG